MKLIKTTTWQEVYQTWKNQESGNPFWRDHFTRKGFGSWEEWRATYVQATQASQLTWALYHVDPNEIPKFSCGAFSGWLKNAEQMGSRKFKHLAKSPNFLQHEKIEALKHDFPKTTQLIAFKRHNNIILFEGHHRAVAITQLLEQDKLPAATLTLALATAPKQKTPYIDFSPAPPA